MVDGYERLAIAIIKQAANDYRSALRGLKKNPHYDGAQHMKRDCERFFRSQFFDTLTTLDGEWLMDRLREEVGYYDC